MDARRSPVEALLGASSRRTSSQKRKTLLVHPFSKNNENKCYLLETPKELKRKTPLLELPKYFTKKPRLFNENQDNSIKSNSDMKKTTIQKTGTFVNVQSENTKTCQIKFSSQNDVRKSKTDLKNHQSEPTTSESEFRQSEIKTCQSETKPCQSETKPGQSETITCQSDIKCHHCCCKGCHKGGVTDECCSKPVKVIFAPAMMPSIFGPVPGYPYIIKQPVKANEKV